ncbi:MAG: CAP domain-containing protein [Lautropia sp.]
MKLTRSARPASGKPTVVVPGTGWAGVAPACLAALLVLAGCGGGGGGSDPTPSPAPIASGDSAAVQVAGTDTASDATPVASGASNVPARASAAAVELPAAATPAEAPAAAAPLDGASGATAGDPVSATTKPAPAPAGATVDATPVAATTNVATVTDPAQAAPQTEAVLAMINLKRASTQKCGDTYYAPARALLANLPAEKAATQHSAWMQKNLSLSHIGANNSDPGSRLLVAGYLWGAVAENVAAGYDNAQQTIDAWMASAPHCANIMRGDFSVVGFSIAPANGTTVAYATLVLAKAK